MSPDSHDRFVIVAGASGRLGRALTRHLLDTGATVVGIDAAGIDPAAEHEHFHALTADLTDERGVERVFADAARIAGAPSALIHVVGMWDGKPLVDTSLEDWRRVMDVNLTSAFLCFREALRHFRGHGRLVAVASKQGTEGGVAQQAAYSASKAGVVRLVEATARELAGTGITAAAVAPSMILFGGEDEGTQGVSVARIAALCTYLSSEVGAEHNGSVIRAFGTML
jgi:NAD(P)-dependent dehydrogenase (short-subunit alcohol dehydrogenase family)